MKKNDGVICSVQSADRDEQHFENPDKFDMHRPLDAKDTLGFGWGPHRCQGEWLSRAELETVFGECLCPHYTPGRRTRLLTCAKSGMLFQKLPDLRLAEHVKNLKYTPAEQNVGITEVPVLW